MSNTYYKIEFRVKNWVKGPAIWHHYRSAIRTLEEAKRAMPLNQGINEEFRIFKITEEEVNFNE